VGGVIGQEDMLERFDRVRRLADGSWLVTCRAHEDRNPSLHITLSGDRWLLDCKAGCSFEEVLAQAGLKASDLFAENGSARREIVATYDYVDETGRLLFQVVRFAPKDFRQRRPDGAGGWEWRLNGTRRVLYRLPNVIASIKAGEPVFVVEGEKDVHALERFTGLAATCNPGGAGKWRAEFSEALRGADVAVVSDRDEPGRKHATEVARALEGVAADVSILEPTKGKDVAEHLANGGRLDELVTIALFGSCGSTPRNNQNDPNPQEPFAAPMSEKLAGVPPEPDWLWNGYLAPGSLTLLAGRPKVGKTTLLFPLIRALEAGAPFLGLPTRCTRVLMLSEEREQTLAEKRELYLDGADPMLLMRHEVGERTWSEVVEQARGYCRDRGISVLVVDTWDKWTGLRGANESKAGSVIEALEPLMLAAGDGLAVLILAHQRKSGGRFGEAVRGSNALTGGVDVIVELERAPENFGGRMRVLRSESRFTATPDALAAELVDDEGYVPRGLLEDVERESETDSVAQLVADAPGSSTEELAEAAEVAPATMKHKLKTAHEAGAICREASGKRGDPYRWRPSETFGSCGSIPRDDPNTRIQNGGPPDADEGTAA
jgi:hypothetical protein